MAPELQEKVERLYHAAAELESGRRSAFLDQIWAGNEMRAIFWIATRVQIPATNSSSECRPLNRRQTAARSQRNSSARRGYHRRSALAIAVSRSRNGSRESGRLRQSQRSVHRPSRAGHCQGLLSKADSPI